MNIELFNNIISKFKIEGLKPFDPFEEGPYYRTISISKNRQYSLYTNENLSIYQKVLENLYLSNQQISSTISKKYFEEKLKSLIIDLLDQNAKANKDLFEKFFRKLLDMELQEYFVLKPIIGIKLLKDKMPQFGPVKIIQYANERHEKYIRFLASGLNASALWGLNPYSHYALVQIVARDSDKALEKAETILYRFELFLKYALARSLSEGEHIGIVNISFPLSKVGLLIAKDGTVSSKHTNTGITKEIPIDDDYFFNEEVGNIELWNLLTTSLSNPNKIKMKIIQAIIWVGKAFSEQDFKISLLEFTMSLEALFSNLEKGIITPGITYNISESIALLIGKNLEERMKIEETVKKIYSLRSAIAHGDDKEISQEDLYIASSLCIRCIREFLLNKEIKEMQKTDDLLNYFKRKKYE